MGSDKLNLKDLFFMFRGEKKEEIRKDEEIKYTKEDLRLAWLHGAIRVPLQAKHLNNFDDYFKFKYENK